MRHLILPFLLIFHAFASAQELHTFSNGEVADASEVNANFEALRQKIISLEERLASLEPTASCLTLSGQDDAVLLGTTENLFELTNELTLTAWVRLEGACLYGHWCSIFSAEHSNSSVFSWNQGFALLLGGGETHFAASPSATTVTDLQGVWGTVGVPESEWAHVAITRSSTSWTLYINGEVDVQEPATSTSNFRFDGGGWNQSETYIGKRRPNGTGSSINEYFPGDISRVGVWGRPLSGEDIQSMYAETFDYVASNPAGFWPLNETSGSVAKDLSGFGNDGVLQGNARWSEDCF